MPHSTYSKIYDVLLFCKSLSPTDIFTLSEEVKGQKMESFAIWKRSNMGLVKDYCSPESIRRLLRFMNEIELLEIDQKRVCKISTMGLNAATNENYRTQLSAQLLKYMREFGKYPFDRLVILIGKVKPPEVPTSYYLFKNVEKEGAQFSEVAFKRLLFLLEKCGKINALVQKIYYVRESR